MGLFGWFKRNRIDEEDDEEEFDEEIPEAPAGVSLEGQLELKICKPRTMEQLSPAVDYLLAGRTVLLNLEGVDKSLYLRMIDFISGAAYALNVSIKKATKDSYFIAPRQVDVSGEIFDTKDEDEEYFTI